MNTLFIQIRVALTTLLLCLSSLSSAIQIHLDERSQECTDIKNSYSAQYHESGADDQDSEPCLNQDNKSDIPPTGKLEKKASDQKQIGQTLLHPIRAPPVKR